MVVARATTFVIVFTSIGTIGPPVLQVTASDWWKLLGYLRVIHGRQSAWYGGAIVLGFSGGFPDVEDAHFVALVQVVSEVPVEVVVLEVLQLHVVLAADLFIEDIVRVTEIALRDVRSVKVKHTVNATVQARGQTTRPRRRRRR